MKELIKSENGQVSTIDLELVEDFSKALNIDPRKNEIQVNKHAGNSKYLPISFVQMELDEMFFGIWNWEVTDVRVVANEIMVWGVLEVFHPTARVWIRRSGTGAAMILQKSGADITDLSAKIKNTLVKDFPHAEAEALKSAAKKLGKKFGRDLNRDYTAEYNSFLDSMVEASGDVGEDVKAQLDNINTIAELNAFARQNENLFNNDLILDLFSKKRKELESKKK